VTAISIFMLFVGGATGSLSSILVSHKFHWQGVGILGLGFIVLGRTIHFAFGLGLDYSKGEVLKAPPVEAVAEMESMGTSAGSYTEGPTEQSVSPQTNIHAPIRKPGFA
jgi:hypothetical protein